MDSSLLSEQVQSISKESMDSSLLSEQAQGTPKENLEDYETQLLGFTPKSFISGIYNAVSEYFMEALKILEDYMQKKYSEMMTASEVTEKFTRIRKHLVGQIDKAFDTLEVYLATNIFCVPHNVVLPEDQRQMDFPVSEETFSAVQHNIQDMKDRILAVKLANAVLKQHIQHTMQVQDIMDQILDTLNSTQAASRQEGVVDLRDSLSHCAKSVLSTVRLLSNIDLNTEEGASEAKKKK